MSEKLSQIYVSNPTTALGTGCILYIYNPAIVSPTNRSSAIVVDNIFANPSNSVGLTANNGADFTAMRSDATPALSQAIVPTWSGAHTWSSTARFNGTVTLAALVNFSALTASTVLGLDSSKDVISLNSLIANGMLYATGTGAFASTASPLNGQLLVGSTGAAPVLATLSGTANQITVTNGAGTITLAIPFYTANTAGFSIAGGTTSKTLKVDNTLELAGTDGTKFTFPAASDTVGCLATAQTWTAAQTMGQGILQATLDYCSVTNTTNQALVGSNFTVLSFDTNVKITNAGMHSTSVNPSHLIAVTAGWYRITMNPIVQSDSTTTQLLLAVEKNGTTGVLYAYTPGIASSSNLGGSASVDTYLNAGDYVTLSVTLINGTTGGNVLGTSITAFAQSFTMTKISN